MTDGPPVVDLAGLAPDAAPGLRARAIAELRAACEGVGAFYVAGAEDRVPRALRDGLVEHTRRLFELPLETKLRHHVARSRNHRGYVPRGEERYGAEPGVDDAKEGWDLALDLPADDPDVVAGTPMLGPNVWPAELPEARAAIGAYYDAVLALGRELLEGFTEALGLAPGTLATHVRKPTSQLRLLHYPPHAVTEPGRLGIGAHTDFELFTIQITTSDGLEIQGRDGAWRPAPPRDGALLVFLGDMIEVWTNGRWPATPHRVIDTPERRYSFPFFFSVDYATRIEPLERFVDAEHPPRYAPVLSGDHLWARTREAFAYLHAPGDASADADAPTTTPPRAPAAPASS